MFSSKCLTTANILAAFTEEITLRHGKVTDTFDDGARLFTRAVLPKLEEVRPKDQLQAGVALRATQREAWLHPYVFRLVCRNGAIMAQAIQTQHLTDLHLRAPEEALGLVREAAAACCAEEAFTVATQQMRSAREVEADLAINILPLLARFSSQLGPKALEEIIKRFF